MKRYTHAMEYYSAIGKNQLMPFAEMVMLNEVSQIDKEEYHDIVYLQNFIYIYTHTHK